ncbi:hypothetical protein LWI28_015468 [Acer negundo]|uniref:Uncharacterized protein n=1 Tax=Acer negundo TaxID=4023 RepID=A0AAD5P5Y6_ACENE|nr:hypothetical protein LWI28_015468 [Acer negundo]KAK4850461.1 hypothetical protein QYF36_006964 [Acer negundo]
MVEKPNKRHKKGLISEADISTLLQSRYTTKTVLALLQEVAHSPGLKLDWNALVKNTSTGISNAREYQMLWRHLAYRNALLDKLEDEAQPLDDDSDLEYELEPFPDVSNEAATEAAACVKVLIASGLPSDSSLPNSSTVEAPLTINIPNGQSFRGSSENSQPASLMQGMNITVPVSVQKLPLPSTTSTEALDNNGSISGNMPPRKKRKPWTAEEDMELIASVQKSGEGNWATILRGDYKWDRTASQLSQRWSILRKKNGSILGANSTGSHLSEAQLAARHAMSLALDMPVKNITASSTNNNVGTTSNFTGGNSMPSTSNAEALPANSSFVQAQSQPQPGSIGTKSSPLGSLGSAAKPRIASKKMPANFSSESSLRAAAVAAGARIVTPSDAASLLKVAQAKNAIHIMPSGVSTVKSSMSGSAPSHLEAHPSVRYIRTSMGAAPPSTNPAVTSSALQPSLVKAALPRVQQNTPSEPTNAVIPSPAAELPLKPDAKVAKEIRVSDLSSVSGNELGKKVQEDKVPSQKPESELKNQVAVAENPDSSLNIEMTDTDQVRNINNQAEGDQNGTNETIMDNINNQAEGDQNGTNDTIMGSPVKEIKNQPAVEENGELRCSKQEQSDSSNMLIDECSGNPEQLSEIKASEEMQA